ncbi:DMT family transporter [Sphingomonas sp. ID0503]|uniref:DMT family transporter n=1 Tax=Sphingomonas sp. ID0503 TaxID=3399691 RepID=UPI003AFA9607
MHRRSAQEPLSGGKARLAGLLGLPSLLLANVLLAFGPWMVRLAGVGPVAAGFWRLTIAAPLIVLITMRLGQRLPARNAGGAWVALVCGGLFFAADLAAWHAGILHTRLANATLFGNVTSFLFPIYGFIVARQLPGRGQAIALALAATGVVLLMGRSYELSPKNLMGDGLCLLAGIFYTGYLILADRAGSVSPFGRLTVMTLTGTLPLLLTSLAFGEQVWPDHWGPLLLLALGSQVFGQGLIILSISRVEPIVVGLTLLIQPIIAATLGWVFYGERLTLPDYLGAALIAGALLLVRRPQPPADAAA